MQNQSLYDELLSKVPDQERRFVTKQGDIAYQIAQILAKKGWSQRDLAKETGMKESQISRILSGGDNITIKTLARIESALRADILVAPSLYEEELCEQEKYHFWGSENAQATIQKPMAVKTHEKRMDLLNLNISSDAIEKYRKYGRVA